MQKNKKPTLGSIASRLEDVATQMVQRFEVIDKRFEGVDQRFKGVNQRLEAIDKRMDSFEASQRKTGVLLERLEYKFDLALEGFGVLNKKTADLEARVNGVETKIDALSKDGR